MSDAEAAPEDDDVVFEEDHAHQACYVFRPFTADETGNEKPAKKRRKIKHTPDEQTPIFPLLDRGTESAEYARLRYDTFEKTWAYQKERIESLIEKADEAALTQVIDFVQQPSGNDAQRLRTGLIISGSDSGAQNRVLDRWRKSQTEDAGDIVIQLRASQCTSLQTTLKHIIKSTICHRSGQTGYQAFLNRHKRLIPMSFDLELLQIFVKDNNIKRLVLSVLDVETFDISVLSELFSTLCSWSDTIPFIILLGIATTIELFESRLPKSTINLLDATTFDLQSSDDTFQQILDEINSGESFSLTFGPLTVSALGELRQNQGTTIETFMSAIKYVIMSHFFANSLSVKLAGSELRDNDRSLCKAIRNTPSFQDFIEHTLNQAIRAPKNTRYSKKVSDFLSDDASLFKNFITGAQVAPQPPNGPEQSASPFRQPEPYTINSRSVLHPFTARSRHALERALSKPSDYLACDCCQTTTTTTTNTNTNLASPSSSTTTTSAPPTSTLYTLLQEAGTIINVRDLYDAFCARQFPFPLSSSTDTDTKVDRTRLTTFYTSLAELKMLGFVKPSSNAGVKKRAVGADKSHQQQQQQDGGNVFVRGKDRYGDVDLIAKTGWAGL